MKKRRFKWPRGLSCLIVLFLIFGYLGYVMGTANMMNSLMKTAHDILINTVFYIMAICVLTGALAKILLEFGVVALLEKLLKPLMKPLFNLPGLAAVGAIMTFLSDNPAIVPLAMDKRFGIHFKKYQFVSLINFGTAFGMGLLVLVFMFSQGFTFEPVVGLVGASIGGIVSTRLMQNFTLKKYPEFKDQQAYPEYTKESFKIDDEQKQKGIIRFLDAILDGGKNGVDTGLSVIPGVLVIATFVMILTFGPSETGVYTGAAYEGTAFLPMVFGKIGFVFDWLFGFDDPHLVSFPITSLGAVGAALSLVPSFVSEGWMNGNGIAVCTAIGMCWSGYLSTHTALLDTLGYRDLAGKAILAHTIGGLVAGVVAHWIYLLVIVLI